MATLLVAMVGCNKEIDSTNDGGISSDDKVYMTFSIQTATTRSATDAAGDTNSNANPDYEVGTDVENKISKVDIVLCNNDSYVVADDVVPTGSGSTYIASFNSLTIAADTEYAVYIYANCDAPATKDLDATTKETVANMTKDNNFWMTNAYEAKKIETPEDMSIHTSQYAPLNLGAHYLERSMARFDITCKDPGYTFEIGGQIFINLQEAAIINQGAESYMLRRVSADGTATGWVVGGTETPSNYVVSPMWAEMNNGWNGQDLLSAKKGEFLSSPMIDKSTWNWVDLPTLFGNDYQPWQYCKENTIPGATNQLKGFTTAIVFKAELDSENETIAEAMDANETLYMFENILYGSWDDVEDAASKSDAPATLVAAVAQVNSCSDDLKENGSAYTTAGFTGYSPDENNHYYCYYYYYNRHNDNLDPAKMGPMEYAVVRNNVYKLSIDKIKKIGHPDDPSLDPEPEDPSDPNESINYYFNVTAKVLPWVVRENHIEF